MADGPLSTAAVPPAFTQAAPAAEVDLRPLTTSELIDRGFALYRAHFTGFLLLALLCQSAPLLHQIALTSFKLSPWQAEFWERPETLPLKIASVSILGLVTLVIVFCFEVIITFYIADAYLGKVPSVKASLRKFRSCIVSSIWTCVLNRFLIGITFFFPLLAFAAIYFYALFYPPLTLFPLLVFGGASLLLFVAALAPVLVVFMRLMITVPALALEGYSGWKAIKRSAALVRYDPGLGILYWGEMRLSFLLLPLFIIELLILSLTSLPLTLHQIGEVMRHGSSGQIAAPPDSIMILSQILTFLAGSLILPLYSIATTLFYYDIRIRREGFDLEFMAGQLGGRK
jgi:hypothetical protein